MRLCHPCPDAAGRAVCGAAARFANMLASSGLEERQVATKSSRNGWTSPSLMYRTGPVRGPTRIAGTRAGMIEPARALRAVSWCRAAGPVSGRDRVWPPKEADRRVAVVFLLVRFCRRRYYSCIDRHQKLFAGDLERSIVVLIISGLNCPESGS